MRDHFNHLQNILEKQVRDAEDAAAGRSTLDSVWGNLNSDPSSPASAGRSGSGSDDGEDEYEDIYEDSGEVVGASPSPSLKMEGTPSQSATSEQERRQELDFESPLFPESGDGSEEDEYEELDVEEFLKDSPGSSSGFAFRDRSMGLESSSSSSGDDTKSAADKAADTAGAAASGSKVPGQVGAPAASRFAAQMSGDWNRQVLEGEGAAAAAAGVGAAQQLANDVPQELAAAEATRELSIDEQVGGTHRKSIVFQDVCAGSNSITFIDALQQSQS